MIDPLFLPIGLLYFLVSGALFVIGVNFIYFSILTVRESRASREAHTIRENPSQPAKNNAAARGNAAATCHLPPAPCSLPRVTVQLPIYNEMYVARRVIEAAARLDYPPERLQIQVLDDSTDETVAIARRTVKRLQEKGLDIVRIHRTDRQGYKAGALRDGMASATGEYIAIFDADFVPPPGFLRRALPHIVDDPQAAFVQTRWGHVNKDYSWLTQLQSLAIDAHFMVEQFARSHRGYWFNFNGTAGIWRRAAIEDAGGWTADTLTEDLDLSYRAHLKGWHGRYTRDIVVPGELPPSFSAFRKQQNRWARGSLECALKLSPRVWRAPIPLSHKIQATLHLTGYSVHIFLFVLTLIYPLVAFFTAQHAHFSTLYGFAYLFVLTSLAPTLFFVAGQQQQGPGWRRKLPKILAISVVGMGLMVNTVRAACQIWVKKDSVFERTAKFGIEEKEQDWTRQRYQLRFDPIVYVELALGAYSLWSAWFAAGLGSWGIVFYALLFGIGLVLTGGVTIAQTTAIYRSRKARLKRAQIELTADYGAQ